MAGPWEAYQQSEAGPWKDYQAKPKEAKAGGVLDYAADAAMGARQGWDALAQMLARSVESLTGSEAV